MGSLKTVFVYLGVVCVCIIISLTIKIIHIVQNNTFDGKNHFIVSVVSDNKVKEILGFDPEKQSLVALSVKMPLDETELGSELGILPDATIVVPSSFSFDADTRKHMSAVFFSYPLVKTNATVFDIARLMIFSKRVSLQNNTTETIEKKDTLANDKVISLLLKDEVINAENITIQIVNAAGMSGMGKRLEHVLTNLGANVVALSTAREKEQQSHISYFGEKTYTLDKLASLFDYPANPQQKKGIADIIIVLGEDSKETTQF